MKQKMHKLSVNVVDYILVKQLVGVMKEKQYKAVAKRCDITSLSQNRSFY